MLPDVGQYKVYGAPRSRINQALIGTAHFGRSYEKQTGLSGPRKVLDKGILLKQVEGTNLASNETKRCPEIPQSEPQFLHTSSFQQYTPSQKFQTIRL